MHKTLFSYAQSTTSTSGLTKYHKNQMKRRDNFSLEIKRKLAARAGNKCSICEKTTSGPGSTPDSTLSDGIAAHITAASPRGPRFDATLSTEQRISMENGIWACTKHGREIDSDANNYSVELLRGLKRQREEYARQELKYKELHEDRSAVLVEFPYVETIQKLFEIISPQTYTRTTTSSLRDLLSLSNHPSQILDLASEVIIATWESYPNISGILSTILSNSINLWNPSPSTISKLQDLCKKAIKSNDWSQVAAVEPLAFAISGKGHPNVHRNVLDRLIGSSSWREADAARINKYYGNIGNEIAAIIRHWNDQSRNGLLKANDTARLIDLLLSNNEILKSGFGRLSLINLLQNHAIVLKNSGEPELAKKVMEFVSAFQQSRQT